MTVRAVIGAPAPGVDAGPPHEAEVSSMKFHSPYRRFATVALAAGAIAAASAGTAFAESSSVQQQSVTSAPAWPPDYDGDGVPDSADGCPTAGGPYVNSYGCPPPVMTPPDFDGDGVPDSADGCPTAGGPFVNSQGCPPPVMTPPDTDGDGVPNSHDACPDSWGAGMVDAFGCPVTIPQPSPAPAPGGGG